MQKKLKRPAQWRTHAVEKAGSKDNEGNNGNTDKNDTQETARATRVVHGNFRAAHAQEKRKRAERIALARSAKAKHEVNDPFGF